MKSTTSADDCKPLHITIDCIGTIIAGTRMVLPAGPECLIVEAWPVTRVEARSALHDY